jgi:hypothetical protein
LSTTANDHRIAVRGHPPGRDSVRGITHGWQDDLNSGPIRVERDARATLGALPLLRLPGSAPTESVICCLLAARLDDPGWQDDAIKVEVRILQPVEQIQATVDHVKRVVAAKCEKTPSRDIQPPEPLVTA